MFVWFWFQTKRQLYLTGRCEKGSRCVEVRISGNAPLLRGKVEEWVSAGLQVARKKASDVVAIWSIGYRRLGRPSP